MIVTSAHNSIGNEYEEFVDALLLERLERHQAGFGHLLTSLPGIYPSTVLRRLAHLASTSQIRDQIFRRLLIDSRREYDDNRLHELLEQRRIRLPIEHPLDYEWRFGETAAKLLLDTATGLASGNLIGLVGTPSILRYAVEQEYSCSLVLIDKNPLLGQCFNASPAGKVFTCDLAKDPLPDVEASAVIIDPPWYKDYMRAFIWAGCALSGSNSHLLMSIPAEGTRPGISDEMEEMLCWMRQELGLTRLNVHKAALPYRSPLFERNALRAEGILNVPSEWRRGDLWIFKTGNRSGNHIPRPTIGDVVPRWREEVLWGMRLRLRNGQRSSPVFTDPSLKSLVDKDVLSSVSRRDPRRDTVDVWTSGNRVFASSGTQILHVMIRALAAGNSAHDQVSGYINRELEGVESSLVSTTVDHLKKLADLEREEDYRYGGWAEC